MPRAGWLLAFLLTGSPAPADAPDPVELSVLSYNAHGLSAWIAGDDPEARFPRIAERANSYDVALIQEDFAHHEVLARHASQPVIERGNPPRLAIASVLPLFGGSGLTVLAHLPPEWAEVVARESFDVCAGWLDGANDCWASKGLLGLRARLRGSRGVDLYNTHLDAGGREQDQSTREVQLRKLGRRIRALSGEGALIVAGDFNLDFERPVQRAALRNFTHALGLRDSGAKRRDPERWRRIDYIFYRSGGGVELEVVEAGEAVEFVHEGAPLSDHPALFARFRIR